MAVLLAAGSTIRRSGPGVEHHDVDVGRVVLRCRFRGGGGRRQYLETPWYRIIRRAGTGTAEHSRGVLRHWHDAAGDPGLRSVAVSASGRVVAEVPFRDDSRGNCDRSLVVAHDAPHEAVESRRRCTRWSSDRT